ncbi:MAG: hypothetical protein M1819_006692 [Sarea resinae]|nr:MAG: hypothetical protein M1819_006692 [Sarea resinae]
MPGYSPADGQPYGSPHPPLGGAGGSFMTPPAQYQFTQLPYASIEQRPSVEPRPDSVPASDSHCSKVNRLRKACDSCSIRKVKCDESGPPCRACSALDIPCTFERPSRRRGPPNRHAEAIKRRRLESPDTPSGGSTSPTPTRAARALASLSTSQPLSAESICPLPTVKLLVDDFFTYIHPLVPIPHEPTFRAAFERREDLTNPTFLALLASMIGCLVASFPRKPRLHLKTQNKETLFSSSMSLVERCHQVVVEARGPGYLDKDLGVHDAAISYFLGVVGAYTFNWRQCRLYLAECLTISRGIGLHKPSGQSYNSLGGLPTAMGVQGAYHANSKTNTDLVTQEIGRRLFWILFVGVRSIQQLVAAFGELFMPSPTPSDPYPPLPLEIDDEYIFPDHLQPQPQGVISKITGFNANVRVFSTYNSLSTMEMAYGIDEMFDWDRQKKVLNQCLRNIKSVLNGIPEELMLQPGNSMQSAFSKQGDASRHYRPRTTPRRQNSSSEEDESPEQRRKVQYEIQKANIYASQLGTRSYIIEKYWNLCEAHNRLLKSGGGGSYQTRPSSARDSPGIVAAGLESALPPTTNYDLSEAEMSAERENVVKDLLMVLGSISQVNMEPNGASFICKIRQIASTLLDVPPTRKGAIAQRTEQYLAAFLDILMKLERQPHPNHAHKSKSRSHGGTPSSGPRSHGTGEGFAAGAGSGVESPQIDDGGQNGIRDGLGDNRNGGVDEDDDDDDEDDEDDDEDEEMELRHWADLREYQSRFVRAGGILSEL